MDSDNLEVEITEDMILTGDLERENIERLQGNLNPRVLKLASIVRTEANAPEILPYEEKLLDGITEAIRSLPFLSLSQRHHRCCYHYYSRYCYRYRYHYHYYYCYQESKRAN